MVHLHAIHVLSVDVHGIRDEGRAALALGVALFEFEDFDFCVETVEEAHCCGFD